MNQSFFGFFILPMIIFGVLYTILCYRRARDGEAPYLLWLTAVAFGIGYIIGYLFIEGSPEFLPKESIKWSFYLTLLAIGSSSYWRTSQLRRFISQLLYSVGLPRLLLDSYFRYHWGAYEGLIWWICLSIGIFIFWFIVQQSLTAPPSGAACPYAYFAIAFATFFVLSISGSVRLALHAATLNGLFMIIWIPLFFLKHIIKIGSDESRQLPINTAPVITVLLVVFWLNGCFYADVPAASVILLAASPILAQVGNIEAIQKIGSRKSVILQVGLIVVCVSIAVLIAVLDY